MRKTRKVGLEDAPAPRRTDVDEVNWEIPRGLGNIPLPLSGMNIVESCWPQDFVDESHHVNTLTLCIHLRVLRYERRFLAVDFGPELARSQGKGDSSGNPVSTRPCRTVWFRVTHELAPCRRLA